LSPACCLAEAKQLSSGSRSLTLYFVCKLTSPERANRLAPPFPAIDISDWDVGFARVVTLSSSLEIERNLDAFAKLAGIQKTSSSANTFFYNQDFPHPLSPWMTMCWLPSKRCFSAASRSPRATYMLSFTSAFPWRENFRNFLSKKFAEHSAHSRSRSTICKGTPTVESGSCVSDPCLADPEVLATSNASLLQSTGVDGGLMVYRRINRIVNRTERGWACTFRRGQNYSSNR
jgi:hypothetical protein